MLLTEKTILTPTNKQIQWLWQMSMSAVELYNIALQQRRWHFYRHHSTAKSVSYKYQNSQLVELKEAFPCFGVLYSLAAEEVLRLVIELPLPEGRGFRDLSTEPVQQGTIWPGFPVNL